MSKKVPFAELKPKNVDDKLWTTVVDAWENGLNDREAAYCATYELGEIIKTDTIKKWKKDDPRITELCVMLKDGLTALAKRNAKKLLKAEDDKTTRWYLEHRCPEEFSTKSAVAFEGAVEVLSLEEKEKALKEYVENFGHGE